MRRPAWNGRSRSVPDIREEPRHIDDNVHKNPSIYVEDFRILGYETPMRIEDVAEHVKPDNGAATGGDVLPERQQIPSGGPHDAEIVHSGEESQFTLSDQRSRRRVDSDNKSQTETIVPRRNLTVLDVAALIFNKMV
jgi:hypothetical protein